MSDDLITAAVLRRGSLEWTSLRRRKNRLDVAEHHREAFELPPGVTDLQAPEVIARLKPLCARLKGRLAVALPTEQVLMRVVRFPTLDAAEIRDMAALQVDKFSPFPIEQMAVGQEILDQQEGASRVLIAAAQQDHVDRLGAVLDAAGASPREVDIEVLGWWRLLRQEKKVPAEGRHILVLLEASATDLIVVQEGVPVMLRSLGSHAHLEAADSASEIAEELNYTLTTLEAEWGAQAARAIHIWHAGDLSVEFLARLRESCEAEVETHALGPLPPLSEGLARRAAERGPHMADLAPASWKSALETRRLNGILLTAAGVFLGLWLVVVATLFTMYKLETGRLAEARASLKALQEPARQVEELKEQVKSLERYADRTYSGLECLREISSVLPGGLDITALTYKKYGQVNVRGEANSSDPIYDFFQALENSQMFPAVKPEGVTQQPRGGRMKSQFKVTIELPGEAS